MADENWEPLPDVNLWDYRGSVVRREFDGVTTTGVLRTVGHGEVWLGEHGGVKVATAGVWSVLADGEAAPRCVPDGTGMQRRCTVHRQWWPGPENAREFCPEGEREATRG